MIHDLNVETIEIDRLTLFDDNPRSISGESLDRLCASIREFGLFAPLITWKNTDGTPIVIGGNQRLTAIRKMRDLGEHVPDRIPVVVVDCSEAEARTIVLRDNTHDGDWDWGDLSSYLTDLVSDDDGFDFQLTGFDKEIFEELVSLGSDPLLQATSPNDESVGDDRHTNDGDDTRTKSELEKPAAATATRFVIGNIRGKVPIALYGRLVGVIDARSSRLGTQDLGVLLGSLLDDLEVPR